MRVLRHRRAPSVEHRGNANLGAKPLGIGGDRQGGFGRRGEQDAIDDGLIVESDLGDRRRHGEDDVPNRRRPLLDILALCCSH